MSEICIAGIVRSINPDSALLAKTPACDGANYAIGAVLFRLFRDAKS